MIQIGLVAPTLAARIGLRALLGGFPDLAVAAEAGSLSGLGPSLEALDVIVLAGASLASNTGQEWLRQAPGAALLLLGDDLEQTRWLRQVRDRPWGLLPGDADSAELAAALRALHEGLIVGAPALLDLLTPVDLPRSLLAAEEARLAEALTEREGEVLQLLAHGLANKQIAGELGISAHTVKFHISSIYAKLGAASRTEAVRLGLQHGLVTL